MKSFLSCLAIAIAFSFSAHAQPRRPPPPVYELACPAGYSPVAGFGKTFNSGTGQWRANLCVSDSGDGTMFCQMRGCGGAPTPTSPFSILMHLGGTWSASALSTTNNWPLNGQVAAQLIYLPVPMTFLRIAWGGLNCVAACPRNVYFGIYNNDATKTLFAKIGPLAMPLSGVAPAASVFPFAVSVPAGTYWLAWSNDDVGGTTATATLLTNSMEQDFRNDYVGATISLNPQRGYAANAVAGGTMPSTLGVVSKADIVIPAILLSY